MTQRPIFNLIVGLTLAAMPVGASAAVAGGLPPLAAAHGHNAAVRADAKGLRVTFQPAEWPNASWIAKPDRAWDWRGRAVLAFDAANPGPNPVELSVRVDDDPSADGVHHCHTATATLDPGESRAFRIDLAAADPMATEGMRGGPPTSGAGGIETMRGSGTVDPAHIVAFQFFLHSPATARTLRFTRLRLLPSTLSADAYRGIVDLFGQYTRADWPGKVHSVADLTARRTSEAKSLARPGPATDRDAYGGWAGGPILTATGYFRSVKRAGRWWLVTPSGHLFLSFGIDAVQAGDATVVQPRRALFTWLPGPGDPLAALYGQDDHILYGPYKSGRTFNFYAANLQRKYGPTYLTKWRAVTAARLKSWGFNTLGNWSDETLEALHRVPYTATLSVEGAHARLATGSDYWGKMHDPFDPQFAADCDASFRDRATRLCRDPWCLGYFVDNELSWGGGEVERGRYGLAYGALAAPAGQPAKRAFLAQLKSEYATVERLNAAWGTSLADWRDLDAPFQAGQKPNDAQRRDMAAFVSAFARRYFTVVHDTLRKYDTNHLYLGCRFAGGSNPDAVRAAAQICDVVSFNVYRPRVDDADLAQGWGFSPALDKPCLIGEFHFGALDRGLFHPGLVAAADQKERAAMFRRFVASVLDNPAFVGAHWFEYVDEPLTGRSLDGENYNIGFVSVTDTPYPEMVQAARLALSQAYRRRAGLPAAPTTHPVQARTL